MCVRKMPWGENRIYEIMFIIFLDRERAADYFGFEHNFIKGGPMPRPRKRRLVQFAPRVEYYKPQGVPLAGLREALLTVDGLEAMRLADAEGLDQEKASQRMGISRPTFSRLVAEARAVVARAMVNGWAIRIEGGPVQMMGPQVSGQGWGQGRRRRRRGNIE
jgi:predicted DNA-binding protein (UPF0251 family)